MSNDQSLKRIFSSSNSNKYPTIGKFLPSFSKQKLVFSTNPDEKSDDNANLDLVDRLINQTLSSRNNATSQNLGNAQTTGRAKEFLRNESSKSLPAAELSAEAEPESDVESNVESGAESTPEIISNPELAELSKEIQEVSKETKEQREQALIKEKQQEIDNLATEATASVVVSDKPVVVLPITAKSKEEAKFKTTKYSVKWLVEWCKKIAKMFSGAVVYKEEVDYE